MWVWTRNTTIREQGREAWEERRAWIDTPPAARTSAAVLNAPSEAEAAALAAWQAQAGRR